MHHLRRTVTGIVAAGMAVLTGGTLAGCGAPAYNYAKDTGDHAYFKVPADWHQVSPQFVAQAQNLLTRSFAGAGRRDAGLVPGVRGRLEPFLGEPARRLG